LSSNSEHNPYEVPRRQQVVRHRPPPDEPLTRFRVRFLPVWLLLFVAAVVGSSGTFGLLYTFSGRIPQIILGTSIVGSFLGAVVVFDLYPVRAGRSGLHGYDFWGVFYYVEWTGIHRVSETRLLTLNYLKLHSDALPRPIWLPLYLKDSAGFWRLVDEHAPVGSPLRVLAGDLAKEDAGESSGKEDPR